MSINDYLVVSKYYQEIFPNTLSITFFYFHTSVSMVKYVLSNSRGPFPTAGRTPLSLTSTSAQFEQIWDHSEFELSAQEKAAEPPDAA